MEMRQHGIVEGGPVSHVARHGCEVGLPGGGVEGLRNGGRLGRLGEFERLLVGSGGSGSGWRVGGGAGFEGEGGGEVGEISEACGVTWGERRGLVKG